MIYPTYKINDFILQYNYKTVRKTTGRDILIH